LTRPKSDRVPVIEDTFGLNLATLRRAAKKAGSDLLTVTWHGVTGLAMIGADRLTLVYAGVTVAADIEVVNCLSGRSRPLMKCPRAHEGNFQTLYLSDGELACRHCHGLRYRSNLAAGPLERARIARFKLLSQMGAQSGEAAPERRFRAWRKIHNRELSRLKILSSEYRNGIELLVEI
jgi:hypothetical protein